MKVSNMVNSRGNTVPNQFIIENGNGHSVFQSYDSTIAIKQGPGYPVLLDESTWDYSRTTSKYRNQFLGVTTKETLAKIDSGEYQLTNLN